jgi:hypothetical protein
MSGHVCDSVGYEISDGLGVTPYTVMINMKRNSGCFVDVTNKYVNMGINPILVDQIKMIISGLTLSYMNGPLPTYKWLCRICGNPSEITYKSPSGVLCVGCLQMYFDEKYKSSCEFIELDVEQLGLTNNKMGSILDWLPVYSFDLRNIESIFISQCFNPQNTNYGKLALVDLNSGEMHFAGCSLENLVFELNVFGRASEEHPITLAIRSRRR